MSYEAWGEPDGRPFPKMPAILAEHTRPALCVPRTELPSCSQCSRMAPKSYAPWINDVTIDGSTVVDAQGRCPMWTPKTTDKELS